MTPLDNVPTYLWWHKTDMLERKSGHQQMKLLWQNSVFPMRPWNESNHVCGDMNGCFFLRPQHISHVTKNRHFEAKTWSFPNLFLKKNKLKQKYLNWQLKKNVGLQKKEPWHFNLSVASKKHVLPTFILVIGLNFTFHPPHLLIWNSHHKHAMWMWYDTHCRNISGGCRDINAKVSFCRLGCMFH